MFQKTMYAFLCYKFSATITRILVKIEIFDYDTALIKNDYFIYSVKEIKRDLENIKVYYRESSGIEIEFDTEKSKADKTIKVLGYIILEIISSKGIALPMKYNVELYEKLYYLNDHNSIEKKKKFVDMLKNLPEYTEGLTTFVHENMTDDTIGRYFTEISNGTFLLDDFWFFKEQ